MRSVVRGILLVVALLGTGASAQRAPHAAALDSFVTAQMTRRGVPGLSLAIIEDGRILLRKAYGVTEAGSATPVTTSTLFQAGSISKSVAAAGALRLVEQGMLALDADVNTALKSWKLPPSALTAAKPVTLRLLLAHSAGLTVSGFPGYAVGAPVPTLVQVLDGVTLTNTAPIRVEAEPDSRWRYSGGGYTVMQQMMLDVTGQSFPDYMRQAVLTPMGMTESSFDQPLPPARAALTATGHSNDGRAIPGRWHVYPEMAAAGLWTTPADLARFAIEIQRSYAGNSSTVLSPAMTRRMLTVQKENDGLGVFLTGSGRSLVFSHGGRDEGFDATMNAVAETGQGVVVMINANDNSRMMTRLVDFVAREYRWPSASAYAAPVATAVRLTPEQLQSYVGRYEFSNNNMLTLGATDGRLGTIADRRPDEEFIALGDDRFASTSRELQLAFTRDASGAISGLTSTDAGKMRVVPRIGPPVALLAPQADPDVAFTAKVDRSLRAIMPGGPGAAEAAALTPEARRDFLQLGAWRDAAGLRSINFIAEQSVAGRGLERHGSAVDHVRYYRIATESGTRFLLVWVTKDGMITDFDMVDD